MFEHYGQGEDEGDGPGVPRHCRLRLGRTARPALGDQERDRSRLWRRARGRQGAAARSGSPYEQFPQYPDLASQPGRDRLTIPSCAQHDARAPDWDELTIPYGDLRNAENAMEAAPDRFRFILERPIVGEPGARWTYCGGATALLGRLIARGTGEPLLDYRRRVLFDPMGFGPVGWSKGRDGEFRAASGLRLLPRDLLKIGQLVLAGGVWNGDQIVPRDWLKRAMAPAVTLEDGRRYGYHWYLGAPAAAGSHATEPGSGASAGAASACTSFLHSTSSWRSTAATTISPARNRGVSTISSSARSCCQASSSLVSYLDGGAREQWINTSLQMPRNHRAASRQEAPRIHPSTTTQVSLNFVPT